MTINLEQLYPSDIKQLRHLENELKEEKNYEMKVYRNEYIVHFKAMLFEKLIKDGKIRWN